MASYPGYSMSTPMKPPAWAVPAIPAQAPSGVTENVPEPHTLVSAEGPVTSLVLRSTRIVFQYV